MFAPFSRSEKAGYARQEIPLVRIPREADPNLLLTDVERKYFNSSSLPDYSNKRLRRSLQSFKERRVACATQTSATPMLLCY